MVATTSVSRSPRSPLSSSVFNDGDEKTLRRTQLCLKGGRHFDEKVSLDSLPLYNPEQWINNPHLTKSVEIMPKDLVKKLKRFVFLVKIEEK